ncbi:unnamed protein product [Cunninghamella echinulata]
MERLDAIRPKSAILGDELAEQIHQPTELEEAVILEIRNRKRKVIRQIEQNFKQLDQCKELLNHMNKYYNLSDICELVFTTIYKNLSIQLDKR